MSTPEVSVVMGVYNGVEYLEQTIESILSQEGCDLEFVVVDDGSTDETGRILDEWAARDSRLRVIHQQNTGLTRALIRGCAEAHGEFVARQDVGDVSFPDRLRKQVEVLRRHPRAVMATCAHHFVGPQGEHMGDVQPRHSPAAWTQILRAGDEATLYGPHHGTLMFRREAYVAAGGYRPEFYYAQDLDLWTRLAAIGTLEYTTEVLYQVGFTHGCLSARFGEEQRQLRRLIAVATRARARGEPEDDMLATAAKVRGVGNSASAASDPDTDTDYFVGSCLSARGDARAHGYFRRVLRHRPFHIKAWAKLLLSLARTPAQRH